MASLQSLADSAGIPFTTNQVGGMFGFFFSDTDRMTNFSQVMSSDTGAFVTFFNTMLEQGISLAPSPFESGFVSAAHGQTEFSKTEAAAKSAFEALQQGV
jgi:glutamate-1-semialdehyde 2,1-aminomutase